MLRNRFSRRGYRSFLHRLPASLGFSSSLASADLVALLSEINRVYRQVPCSRQSYYSFDSITLQLQRQLQGKTESLESHRFCPFVSFYPTTMIFVLDQLDRRVFRDTPRLVREAANSMCTKLVQMKSYFYNIQLYTIYRVS